MHLTPNMHPTRLPGLAVERQRLRQEQKTKPETFTAEKQLRLDDFTDQLLLAMAHAIGSLHRDLAQANSRSRHPGMR